MDKRLLDQVQLALQAQRDTIKRQEQMLDDRDADIATLRHSLRRLVDTRTRELERLPKLFENLENTVKNQTSVWQSWQKYRKMHTQTQAKLIAELFSLGNVQIQLVELLKSYQSAIVPADYLKRDTAELESNTARLTNELNKLANIQNGIEQSQAKITGSQTGIQAELMELNRLLDKLEK